MGCWVVPSPSLSLSLTAVAVDFANVLARWPELVLEVKPPGLSLSLSLPPRRGISGGKSAVFR
ncbi:MAG: hypothetical protein ACTS44_00785 [Candidatus Hodgkinia cicadicola]